MVWSASEDGTLRQHDFREGTSCPPAGSPHQECRNVLVSCLSRCLLKLNSLAIFLAYVFNAWYQLDLRCGHKRSLADPPKHVFALKSCDISSTRPHLLLVGGR